MALLNGFVFAMIMSGRDMARHRHGYKLCFPAGR